MVLDPKTGQDFSSTSPLSNNGIVVNRRPRSDGTFNISNFRSKIDSLGGIARTTLFRIEISIPPLIRTRSKINTETLSFLAASVNFPGIRLTTHPVQRYGIGPQEDMPTGFVTGSCSMNILVDSDNNILKFFRDWTRAIVEYQSASGGVQSNPSVPGMRPFHVNYKKNYETQITISIYDVAGNQTYKVSLTKAFPSDINEMFLAWTNTDQVMYLPLRFAFFDLAFDGNGDFKTGAQAQTQAISLIERVYSGGAAIQSISDVFYNPQNLGEVINQINTSVNGIKQLGNIFGL